MALLYTILSSRSKAGTIPVSKIDIVMFCYRSWYHNYHVRMGMTLALIQTISRLYPYVWYQTWRLTSEWICYTGVESTIGICVAWLVPFGLPFVLTNCPIASYTKLWSDIFSCIPAMISLSGRILLGLPLSICELSTLRLTQEWIWGTGVGSTIIHIRIVWSVPPYLPLVSTCCPIAFPPRVVSEDTFSRIPEIHSLSGRILLGLSRLFTQLLE